LVCGRRLNPYVGEKFWIPYKELTAQLLSYITIGRKQISLSRWETTDGSFSVCSKLKFHNVGLLLDDLRGMDKIFFYRSHWKVEIYL